MPGSVQAPLRAFGRPLARGWARAEDRRPRLGAEAGALVLLAVWSLVPLAILFGRVGDGVGLGTGGRVFTGVDGPGISDQLQYMAWIRDAGENVLFSNRFDLAADPHLFLHPMFVLSGLVWQLGAGVQLAFLLWKPVAVAVLFLGFRAYVRRLLGPDRRLQLATLLLALFFFTPAAWLFDWAGLGDEDLHFGLLVMAVEMFPGAYVWGLWPLAVSVGLMPVFLLCFERALEPSAPGRRSAGWYAGAGAAVGLVVSWAHPWQGLTLLVIAAGVIAWSGLWRRWLLLVPLAATVAPIAYYYALTHTDSAWAFVGHPGANPHFGAWLFLALLPPLLLAALGMPGRDLDLQERALRLWPPATLVVYFALESSWIYHAFSGISLPVAILAVRGWTRLRAPAWLGVAGVAALTLPGMAFYVQNLRRTAPDHFIDRGEGDALEYLERSPRKGGVLTSDDLGRVVPALSGRQTWVGHFTWTPDHELRVGQADRLVDGRLAPDQAQAFVRETGAAFVLSGCDRSDLAPALGSLVATTRRFGCARLYEVRGPAG